MIVYDTYAWIEYFLGTSKGAQVKKLLDKGGYTPSIGPSRNIEEIFEGRGQLGNCEKEAYLHSARCPAEPNYMNF